MPNKYPTDSVTAAAVAGGGTRAPGATLERLTPLGRNVVNRSRRKLFSCVAVLQSWQSSCGLRALDLQV